MSWKGKGRQLRRGVGKGGMRKGEQEIRDKKAYLGSVKEGEENGWDLGEERRMGGKGRKKGDGEKGRGKRRGGGGEGRNKSCACIPPVTV